eukprot:scaffold128_cov328-Pavlova_lutheri.AAC.35
MRQQHCRRHRANNPATRRLGTARTAIPNPGPAMQRIGVRKSCKEAALQQQALSFFVPQIGNVASPRHAA